MSTVFLARIFTGYNLTPALIRERRYQAFLALISMFSIVAAGCFRSDPQVVVITGTFTPNSEVISSTESVAIEIPVFGSPTPDPARPTVDTINAQQYVVQPGDTLTGIAAAHGVTMQTLLSVNTITDPNVLAVGQIILLPAAPNQTTDSFKILPDSRLVRAPGSRSFDIAGFISEQSGYIRLANDLVDDVLLSAADVVQQVSLEFSVDARLLLALLEYRAGWLTRIELDDNLKMFPMQGKPSEDGFDRSGLYRQLAWAANQMNLAYYGWKYTGLRTLEFDDGTRLLYDSGLNAGTIGVQYFLSRNNIYSSWMQDVSSSGFSQLYKRYFGDPFQDSIDPLVPNGLIQPEMVFPFRSGETWFFTGGPHGGWGTGSAWAAIDFAPPDERPDGSPACFVSDFWATAVAPGVIARSGGGVVMLDLDGDGDESTGWSVLYLHMASDGGVEAGKSVQPGDLIGHPSCEGGVSNGTHMHLARRYNGEWIPVSCDRCAAGYETPPFVISGWTVYGYPGQEYQGFMVKGSDQRSAEQGRLTPDNRVSR